MANTAIPAKTIEWGKPRATCKNKYRPIAIAATIFFLATASDILFATALAEESLTQWIWGPVLLACLAALVASLQSDSFKLLHYVADRSRVQLQYQIGSGPLETAKLVSRMQDWSTIKSAMYSSATKEDGSEATVGVVLTLKRPIECGRTRIELQSEHPDQLMALVHAQHCDARDHQRSPDFSLAIA
jgi:hypothetical protein